MFKELDQVPYVVELDERGDFSVHSWTFLIFETLRDQYIEDSRDN